MNPVRSRHPLHALLAREQTTAAAYLKRVADHHRALGYGQMAHRKEKLSRWISGTEPQLGAQLAMAHLHGIDPDDVHRHGWPDWLRLALSEGRSVWDLPWTLAGTVEALHEAGGGPVDRRGFVIASLGTLAATGAHWAATTPAAVGATRGRRIGPAAADLFETRLDTLRHLDDAVGAQPAYDAAIAELRLITGVLKTRSYTAATERRLYAAAAEACRLAGWCAYDSGHLADAEKRSDERMPHPVSLIPPRLDYADTSLGFVYIWVRYADGRDAAYSTCLS